MTPDTESSAPEPPDEDGLEWLREIRRQMAAEANYDPYEMGRRLRERELRCELAQTLRSWRCGEVC